MNSNLPEHATCTAVSPPAVIFLWVLIPLMLLFAKEIEKRLLLKHATRFAFSMLCCHAVFLFLTLRLKLLALKGNGSECMAGLQQLWLYLLPPLACTSFIPPWPLRETSSYQVFGSWAHHIFHLPQSLRRWQLQFRILVATFFWLRIFLWPYLGNPGIFHLLFPSVN